MIVEVPINLIYRESPYDETPYDELATLKICLDEASTFEMGSYTYTLEQAGRVPIKGELKNFSRNRGAVALLHEVIKEIVEKYPNEIAIDPSVNPIGRRA